MDNIDQTTQPSRRTFLIGIGAAVGLILCVSVLAVIILFFGGDKSRKTTTTDPKVVTKQTVEQNLNDATTSLEQTKTDQAAAKAAIDDDKNRVKVGS